MPTQGPTRPIGHKIESNRHHFQILPTCDRVSLTLSKAMFMKKVSEGGDDSIFGQLA